MPDQPYLLIRIDQIPGVRIIIVFVIIKIALLRMVVALGIVGIILRLRRQGFRLLFFRLSLRYRLG